MDKYTCCQEDQIYSKSILEEEVDDDPSYNYWNTKEEYTGDFLTFEPIDDELLDIDYPPIPDEYPVVTAVHRKRSSSTTSTKSTKSSWRTHSFSIRQVTNIGFGGNNNKRRKRNNNNNNSEKTIEPNTEFGGEFITGTDPLSPLGEHDEEDFLVEKNNNNNVENLPPDEYDDLVLSEEGQGDGKNSTTFGSGGGGGGLASMDELAVRHVLPSSSPLGYSRSDGGTRKQRRVLQACLFLALATLFLLSIIFIGDYDRDNNNNNNSSPTNSFTYGAGLSAKPTPPPTAAPTVDIRNSRTYVTIAPRVEDPLLLLESTTPQGKAFQSIYDEMLGDDSEFRILQRFAVMTIYYSTGANDYGSWTNYQGWGHFDVDECKWYGVSCQVQADGDRVITNIKLDNNSLVGMIPPEVCLLTSIESLSLSNNMLSGEIPSCMSSMQELTLLDLHNNQLSGNFPNHFFLGPKLQHLSLSKNQLTGRLTFPKFSLDSKSIKTFRKFRTLRLDNNRLWGEIEVSIILMFQLEELTLHGNDFSGAIDIMCGKRLLLLTADCEEMTCTCCTQCF